MRKRRWQSSRSVSLWWTSSVAGHWLGRSSTCPPDTDQWARGGKGPERSGIDVPLTKPVNHLCSERNRQRSRRCRGTTGMSDSKGWWDAVGHQNIHNLHAGLWEERWGSPLRLNTWEFTEDNYIRLYFTRWYSILIYITTPFLQTSLRLWLRLG